MAFSAQEITRAVRRYDRELFCAQSPAADMLCIYRKTKRYVVVCDEPEFRLLNLVSGKEFVLALTDTWSRKGIRRDWGIDMILEKIRSMDLAHNARLIEEFERAEERAKESKERAFTNELEAWASDSRRAFAKATDDILVHSLSKDEPTKRRKDRSIKNGNC